ncbi:MAG TPA: DUF6522 family protein [Lysobacter sp.]|nr:DUF6522 family protein [Lysobacter sp.]
MSTPAADGGVEIDARLIAPRLGLGLDDFRRLMAERRISVLCERGTGEDEGRVRATFYHGARRVRLVVDREGRLLQADDAPPPR